MKNVIDITDRPDTAAVTALITFGEIVTTSAGRVEPAGEAFTLIPLNGKPRRFEKASGAVEVLRRITDKRNS